MGSYLKISPIRLGKFNNAEYTNFMNRTLNQAVAVGIEKLEQVKLLSTAETLYLKTKPYVGCQTLPQGQQIQKMRGLLSDITTSEMSAHIITLGLSAVVEELGTITTQYSALIEQRSASQLANKLDAGKTVRLELMSNTMTL